MNSRYSRIWRKGGLEKNEEKTDTKLNDLIGRMHGNPVFVDAIINATLVPALVDLGCTIFSVFSDNIANRLNLPRIKVSPKELRLAKNSEKGSKIVVDQICWANIDLDGKQDLICGCLLKIMLYLI